MPESIHRATHVWIRCVSDHGLHPRYRGPYKLIGLRDNVATVNIDGVIETISLARIKPAFTNNDEEDNQMIKPTNPSEPDQPIAQPFLQPDIDAEHQLQRTELITEFPTESPSGQSGIEMDEARPTRCRRKPAYLEEYTAPLTTFRRGSPELIAPHLHRGGLMW